MNPVLFPLQCICSLYGISSTVTYALPVTTLTQSQRTYAQAPALGALLQRLHSNRHTARPIIHGITRYGGQGLLRLYLEQGIGQLRLLLGHFWAKDKTRDLIQFLLSCLQQEIGLPILALNLPYSRFHKWITPTWLTSLCQ